MYEPLIPADVEAGTANIPYSPRYGDVYHSLAGGLAQSEYVFLKGNGLPERWRGRSAFTVLETGFGLGINFLALWRTWREDPQRCQRLHMVSIEAHPFAGEQLSAWLRRLLPASFDPQIQQLVDQWPLLMPGLHRLEFEGGAVTLTLAFGRAERLMPLLECRADAIFLDGFAPRLNPEMWSLSILQQLARCAAPGATAATWAATGAVRRTLSAVGFDVEKKPGFAGKREMTVACLRAAAAAPASESTPNGRAVVVGDGPAGAGVAWALGRRGWEVTVIAPGRTPNGSTLDGGDVGYLPGHMAAAMTPQVDRADSVRARLSRAGVLRAHAILRSQQSEYAAAANIVSGAATRTGTIQVIRRAHMTDPMAETVWRDEFAALRMPEAWLQPVDAEAASTLAGQPVSRGGLFLPQGTLVRPAAWCESLLRHRAIRRCEATVERVQSVGSRWAVQTAEGTMGDFDVVVIAAGVGSAPLLERSALAHKLPWSSVLRAVGGQITLMPVRALPLGAPACIVAGEGYVLPAVEGWSVTGSTYDHDSLPGRPLPVSTVMHAANLKRAQRLLPKLAPDLTPESCLGWTGWRCVVPGRLPVVGPVPDCPGLWLATGFASRGFTWSLLAGELIAGQLLEEPALLEIDLIQAISPTQTMKKAASSH